MDLSSKNCSSFFGRSGNTLFTITMRNKLVRATSVLMNFLNYSPLYSAKLRVGFINAVVIIGC
jgi:hypothetical protein